MDAHKLWMLRDFIGTNKVLFRIPVIKPVGNVFSHLFQNERKIENDL